MKYRSSCLLHHCMTFNYTGSVTNEYGLHMIRVHTNSVTDGLLVYYLRFESNIVIEMILEKVTEV